MNETPPQVRILEEASAKGLVSQDVAAEKREQLKQLFPEVFSEDKIDFAQLQRVLGDWVEPEKERFGLNWPGKADCMKVIQQPSIATLKPIRQESVHFDNTENVFIEGDNLEVLKLLQKSYFDKVKMIYIDPPYNTGKDRIYFDKYAESPDTYLDNTGQIDAQGNRFATNTDSGGRYHSSWLNMMYPRLYLARSLLREDGVIFISIDDNEQAHLKELCDFVFGEQNFVGCAGRITKKSNNKGDYWAPNFDYLLTYVKNIEVADSFFGGVNTTAYKITETEGERSGEKYQLVRLYMSTIQNRNSEQRFWIECPDGQKVIPPGTTFPPERPNLGDGIWRWTRKKFEEERDKIVIKSVKSSNLVTQDGSPARWNVFTKTYLQDVIDNSSAKPNSFIEDHINQKGSHELKALNIPFDYSKPSSLISYLIEVSKVKLDDIILDFFAGSCSTAHAVMKLNRQDGGNRKFICVQLPELVDEKSEARKHGYTTIADIGKERIRRAARQIAEQDAAQPNLQGGTLDLGFKVFRLEQSNFKIWQGDVKKNDDIIQSLVEHVEHIHQASTPEDLLYELLLKAGFALTTSIERRQMPGGQVYRISEGALIICLEKEITSELIDAIAADHPFRVICLDEGFRNNDQLKANAAHTFKSRARLEESEIVFMTV